MLVGDRKLAGVLAEHRGDAVVVGVGVNVSMREEQLPSPGATSLALVGAAAVDRAGLLDAVLAALRSRYDGWRGAGGAPATVVDDYRSACSTLGRQVRVVLPGGDLDGLAVDVDAEGRLVVEAGGRHRYLAAGEVVHLRAAPPE